MNRIHPLRDRVVVSRIKQPDDVRNGIIIPDIARVTEKQQEAKVLAVGPGKYVHGVLIPVAVAAGDHIMIGPHSGTEVKVDGEEFLILLEDEILGIVTLTKAAGK